MLRVPAFNSGLLTIDLDVQISLSAQDHRGKGHVSERGGLLPYSSRQLITSTVLYRRHNRSRDPRDTLYRVRRKITTVQLDRLSGDLRQKIVDDRIDIDKLSDLSRIVSLGRVDH